MKREKITKEEKAEIRQENKSWREFIKRATKKGALIDENDSGVHADDWEILSELNVSEG